MVQIDKIAFLGAYRKMLPSLTQLKKGPGAGGPTRWGELPTDIKKIILLQSIPLNTVEQLLRGLCKTDKEFATLCKDGDVWAGLLTHLGWKPWVEAPNLDAEKAFKMLRNLTIKQQTYLSNWNKLTTTINQYLFENCKELQLTTLPPNVEHILSNAFFGCKKLALTELPSGTNYIASNAFEGCESLRLTALPGTLEGLGAMAFFGCKKLALTALPEAIKMILAATFYGCEKLALTTLPDKLTHIEEHAFEGCHNLALTALPGALVHIGDGAFAGCTNLPPAVRNAINNINPNAM